MYDLRVEFTIVRRAQTSFHTKGKINKIISLGSVHVPTRFPKCNSVPN